MLTDPIADMLTRIRNAVRAKHTITEMPSSRLKVAIAQVLREEGFIKGFDVVGAGPKKKLRVLLAYSPTKEPRVLGLRRISKPGLRRYVKHDAIPRVYGGAGVAVLSTPRGVMTGDRARRENVGGELLAYIW
jgi:small subunit ribosomal protein S8